MHDLQGQTGRERFGRPSGPGAEQIPGAQAEVLGNEQPQTDQGAGNLVGQQLPDLPFQTFGVRQELALLELGMLSENLLGRGLRVKGVEFFFAGRNRRWCVRPSEY